MSYSGASSSATVTPTRRPRLELLSDHSSQSLSDHKLFQIDWNDPGIKITSRSNDCKGDFAIKLESFVEAEEMTGYVALVKRTIDCAERKCFFTSKAALNKSTFMTQLNNSFGSGGMTLALNEQQFSLFIQFLKNECLGSLPMFKGATMVGLQKEGAWVLGKDIELTKNGELVEGEQRKYVWVTEIILRNLPNSIRMEEICPLIKTPFGITIVPKLIDTMRIALQHNFNSAVLAISSVAMALHYSTLPNCPIVVAHGPSETGKTTSIMIALALIGLGRESIYESVSAAFIAERVTSCSLPFGIDDPPAATSISDIVVLLYNKGQHGKSKKDNKKLPQSIPIISTNYPLKHEERVRTRVCSIPFQKPGVQPTTKEQQDAFDTLDDMIASGDLSCIFGWLVNQRRCLSDKSLLREMSKKLQQTFTGRSLENWTLLMVCVSQLLAIANFPVEPIISYVCENFSSEVYKPELIILETLKDIVSATKNKERSEILTFLRPDLHVAGKSVVAIVLGDITLTHKVLNVRQALWETNWGVVNETKDFLKPGSVAPIKRYVNNNRRKCDVIYHENIDKDVIEELKQVCSITNNKTHDESGEDVMTMGEGNSSSTDTIPASVEIHSKMGNSSACTTSYDNDTLIIEDDNSLRTTASSDDKINEGNTEVTITPVSYCVSESSAHTPAGIADVEETFQNEPKKEIVESLAKKGKTAVKRHDKLKDNLSEFYTPSSKKRRTN